MKILHIEEFFHPFAGYQVNMLARIQSQLGHELFVMTSELEKMPSYLTDFFGKNNIIADDEEFKKSTKSEIIRIPIVGYISGRVIFNFIKLFNEINKIKPDVVVVHGMDGFTGIVFILISRWLAYPIVVDCHMLEMASRNKFRKLFRWAYRKFVTPVIIKRSIPVIRVVEDDYIEANLGVPIENSRLMPLGTDTEHFKPSESARKETREMLGVGVNDFIVLYAGKLDEQKGGIFLAEALNNKINLKGDKDIVFIIIGRCSGVYGERVDEIFRKSENKIIRLGTQKYFDLAKIYQSVDLVVFPRQCSMSFFEAQSCGVPVLFEDNPINQTRVYRENSILFKPNDIDSFRRSIIDISSRSISSREMSSRDSREFVVQNYNFFSSAMKFTDLLKEVVGRHKSEAYDKW